MGDTFEFCCEREANRQIPDRMHVKDGADAHWGRVNSILGNLFLNYMSKFGTVKIYVATHFVIYFSIL